MTYPSSAERNRALARRIYPSPSTSVTVAGRAWEYWLDGRIIDSFALTAADGLPCKCGETLYGFMGTPKRGETIEAAILRMCNRYGGFDDTAPVRADSETTT